MEPFEITYLKELSLPFSYIACQRYAMHTEAYMLIFVISMIFQTPPKISLSWVPNIKRVSLIAQLIKNPPAMQETPVQFLGWEDPLEKG